MTRRQVQVALLAVGVVAIGSVYRWRDPFAPIRGLNYTEDYWHVYSSGPHARANPSWSHFFLFHEPREKVEKTLKAAWPHYRTREDGRLTFDVPFEHAEGEPTLSCDPSGCELEVPIPGEPSIFARGWTMMLRLGN